MFQNDNVGLLGATDKKEKKKVIKMKDVFVIPNNLKEKYNKKEKNLKPKPENQAKKKDYNAPKEHESSKLKRSRII